MLTGTSDWYSRVMRMSNDLSKWCETHAKAYGKVFGVSHWSDNSKMMIFSLIALGYPTVLITFAVMWVVVYIQMKFTQFAMPF